jgi:hypothetical protein
MTVYVVTSSWTPSEESEDVGGMVEPITELQVFGDYLSAHLFAEEQVAEHNLHADDGLEEPLAEGDDAFDTDRGLIKHDGDTWIIRNDYDYVFIEIHTEDVK